MAVDPNGGGNTYHISRLNFHDQDQLKRIFVSAIFVSHTVSNNTFCRVNDCTLTMFTKPIISLF